jgi:hypothetical protein
MYLFQMKVLKKAEGLKDPLIYYFDMLGERFAMRQARA